MNLVQYFKKNDIDSFEKVVDHFKKDPYNLYVKEDTDLFLLYTTKNTKFTEQTYYLISECYGAIFDKKTLKPVCYSINLIRDLQVENIEEELSMNFNEYRIEKCYDGSLVRLFNYNGEWRLSTTRCIDARKSFWASKKSFYDLFFETTPNIDLDSLNKNYVYSFVIVHPENRLVVKYETGKVYHIGTRDNSTLLYKEIDEDVFCKTNTTERVLIPKPEEIDNITNISQLKEYLEKETTEMRGVILLGPLVGNSYDRIKLDNNTFQKRKKVRGNTTNLRERYIELLNNPDKLEMLKSEYPEYSFDKVEKELDKLVANLHFEYFSTYINRDSRVKIDPRHRQTLVQLHGVYKNKKSQGLEYVTTIESIRSKLFSLPSHIIIWMLRWENKLN